MNTARVCARCAKIVRPRQKRYTTIKNANPRKKQRCDGGNPCSRCVRLGHICSPQVSSQADSEPQNYRRPRASRSRGGCLSCKARKKKCDEIRPRCNDCRRLNLSCRWRRPPSSSPSPSPSPSHSPHSSAVVAEVQDSTEAPISLSDQITTPSLSTLTEATIRSPSDVLSVASSGPSINPHLHSDEDRSLFNHYFHIVAHVLSRSGDPAGNLFLTAMLPMAAASDTLTSVLLGLSGCHWRRVYPSIWKRALARQGRALAQVNQLLMRSDRVSMLEACATVLLLCLIELCDGTSRVWKWHLKAARTLLTSVGIDSLEATPGGKFCLRLFHYLDSMSTIARCKPPLSQDGKGLAELTATAIPTITTCNDSISGMAPALLEFLGMVNLLAAYRSRRVDELSEIGFRTAATHVQAQLDTWRASYDAAHQEHSVDEDRGVEEGTWDSNTNLATTAFEWAIRLRLHQIVDGYNQRHATVETAISRIMEAVLAIPYGSSVEGILLFPLVIAGASSVDVERRMLVKERLMVMENTVGFGHIPRARELLETVWAEENDCNWAKVRYRQFPGVVFI